MDNKDLNGVMRLSRNRAAILFGKIWQDPTLIRKKTVEENLALASQIALGKENPRLVEIRIKKVLGLVGMRGAEKNTPWSCPLVSAGAWSWPGP